MLSESSFNLIKDLNILFVDIDNPTGRREYAAVNKFFQSDTMLWDFIHEYLPLKKSPQQIDALNVYDVLKANNMGFTHIEVNGRRWDSIPQVEQLRLVSIFKANVRRLKPQLLIVLGRKTYNKLFSGDVPSIRGEMQCGFKSHSIQWANQDGIREGSKVFLMRKNKFKTEAERNRQSRKEAEEGHEVIEKRHGSIFTPIRKTENKRAENINRKLAFTRLSDSINKIAVPDNISTRINKKRFKKPSLN
ncbi:hypothetical protein K501DRAFT_303016 [Backusella circina FSU 941]|nr:hypothetical protein K501DRAFT_303016 [Backusella circina FSU 941]